MKFKTKQEILTYIDDFDVQKYAKSRNFVDWGVSMLSPYITHGIVTIPELVSRVVSRVDIKTAEKFLMELVWKEFFMQVQKTYGNDFLIAPVREDKTNIHKKSLLPISLVQWSTQTIWTNKTVEELENSWWLHNHKRMRLASRCCHRAKLDWKKCADWTYYHFVDGELAPNHLSRQWVNSTFANKPYFMNEENLQKYRPWSIDPDLSWSYDAVSANIFDPNRRSIYHDEADTYETLQTPIEYIQSWEWIMPEKVDAIRILTPWRLDESLLADDVYTLIVLDNNFTKKHPRSAKRLAFVQQYADEYNIPFVMWEYTQIVQSYIDMWSQVILDERRDPVYREVQDIYIHHDQVELLPYSMIYTHTWFEPIMKFFKYRNKTKPIIKSRENG